MAIKLLFLDQIYFGKIVFTSLNHDIVMYRYGKRISYGIENYLKYVKNVFKYGYIYIYSSP